MEHALRIQQGLLGPTAGEATSVPTHHADQTSFMGKMALDLRIWEALVWQAWCARHTFQRHICPSIAPLSQSIEQTTTADNIRRC